MNVYTLPRQRAARQDAADAGASASPQEIKYREDAAGYVAAMLAELRQIAGKAGFEKLVKSIDAAYYDAYGALDAKGRETAPAPRNGQNSSEENNFPGVEPNGHDPH